MGGTAALTNRLGLLRHAIALKPQCGCAAVGFCATVSAQTTTPPTSDQARQEMNNQKQDPLAVQSSGGEDWNMIQGHEKGYLAKSDAQPNSWIAVNFANCDKDQDGKVTEMEYTKCQRPQR